ncbi:MAG: ATP-binding cassette domain-containing protein [Clostridia bacterium]|nr:ATP-binding cassette domain-containing protein [Clostridia bacterium]
MAAEKNEAVVQVESAVKEYGEYTVLSDVSCELERGKIHGLIGRNGSGKTVLMKCICGFVPLTSGRILVNGQEIGRDVDVPPSVGIIIESPGFLPNYSAADNLRFLADISGGLKKSEIYGVLDRVGLDPISRKHVGKFSMGMRQRLGIAQAIMEDPGLLILDEPFNGLDERGAQEMRSLFISLREAGKTLLIASHNPIDIEELCDTVHEMNAGVLRLVR